MTFYSGPFETVAITLPPYDWYVANGGNDSNSGKTPDKPFATIGKLSSVIQQNQKAALLCGSSWREQLNVTGANVTIGSYGGGARPILDASDVIASAAFEKTAGFTNVYDTISAISFIQGGSATSWINVFETGGPGDNPNGQILQNVTSIATCDSTPGSYYIPGLSTGGGVPVSAQIYIHATDGTSPITNGYVYEFSNRASAIYMSGAQGTVNGIEGRKASGNTGAFRLDAGDGSAFTINNCLLRGCNDHSLFTTGGSIVTNSIFIDNYWGTQGPNFIVFYENTGVGRNFTSTGNIFQQDQNIANAGSTVGILSHTGTGTNGILSSTNDWFIGKNGGGIIGYSVQNATKLSISGANGSQVTDFVDAYCNVDISNSQSVSSITFNTFLNILASGLTFNLSGNLVATTLGVALIHSSGSITGTTLNINGDTYYRNDKTNSGDFIVNGASSAASSLTVNNTTFDAAVQHTQAYDTTGGWTFTGGTTAGTANSYKVTQVDQFTWNNTFDGSLAAWQTTVSPQDSAAVTNRSGAAANTLPPIPNVS